MMAWKKKHFANMHQLSPQSLKGARRSKSGGTIIFFSYYITKFSKAVQGTFGTKYGLQSAHHHLLQTESFASEKIV